MNANEVLRGLAASCNLDQAQADKALLLCRRTQRSRNAREPQLRGLPILLKDFGEVVKGLRRAQGDRHFPVELVADLAAVDRAEDDPTLFAHSQNLDVHGWQRFADFSLKYGLIDKAVDVKSVLWLEDN